MQEWIARWRELHPTWIHKLWREDDSTTIVCGTERFQSRYTSSLTRACHLAQRSNIWRYELVLAQGGVYLDTDMEPRANIESAIAPYDAFIASQCLTDSVSGACFGARANHPWMKDAVESLGRQDPTLHRSMGDAFAHALYLRHQSQIHRCRRDVFLSYAHREPTVANRLATADTVAFHRWSCFWSATGYVPLG
jgi:mannosyltransferase OCH1-like enzyme